MSVHINCTHCGALCQVADEFLGNHVRCGKCSQVFVANAEPKSTTAGDAAVSAGAKSIGSKLGSLFSGAKSMFQKPASQAQSAPASAAEPQADTDSQDDIGIDFDGPALDMLEQQAAEETTEAPVLGHNPAPIHGLFRLDIGSCTSVGRVRDRNEDSFLVQHQAWSNLDTRRESALVVVADGMGGHEAGDRASKMTLQHVAAGLAGLLALREGEAEVGRAQIEAAIKAANKAVFDVGGRKGMGSTVDVVVIRDGQVEIGHVGDSRVYHFRDGNLKQITKDQTLVERMIELGQLSREEAEQHDTRNEVTQAIGMSAVIEPAFYSLKLAPGDWLIVACDGLHAHVKSDALTETLQAAPASAALVAHYLVDLANHLGGSDNCTVVAVRWF